MNPGCNAIDQEWMTKWHGESKQKGMAIYLHFSLAYLAEKHGNLQKNNCKHITDHLQILDDFCFDVITLRYSNIAMENGPFEDVFPIKTGDIPIAMLVYQRVPKKPSLQSQGPQSISPQAIGCNAREMVQLC